MFRTYVALFACVWMCGCNCGDGDGGGGPCTDETDCNPDEECREGRCEMRDDPDAGDMRDGGRCQSGILCGTPPACCESGQECVEDQCLAACASGVRCGADNATCCDAEQVCISNACEDPGDPCTDSFECEMGWFCEPTLGRCLPQFDPVTCEYRPVFGAFEATLEWSVTSADEASDCVHPISVPAIVDLDGDLEPEVVSSMACDDAWERGVLRAFRGDTGAPIWSATDASLQLHGRASIAAGDLDGLPGAEIVALQRSTYRLIAFRGNGTLLWEATDTDGKTPHNLGGDANNGAPTIADLNEDGRPEIIFGATGYDSDGVLLWERDTGPREGTNNGYEGGISAVADLDMDGFPEVISGRRAYRYDGEPFWTSTESDGYPAIAQFDGDPQPEVVIASTGTVFYLDGLTGVREWGPITIPGTPRGNGGPPTVADFDGDGEPEIGVAGASSYTVYDPEEKDGILWSSPTIDQSSHATGSSVFDFEGDGAAEVIYSDECAMRVYRGSDGMVLLRIYNSTATIHEYPLVADVDADGNSEIVIVANDRDSGIPDRCMNADKEWNGRRKGIFVYGDARDQWVRTRRIWNQHSYHVTNVAPNASIPMVEMDNWTVPGLNNYRQNVQGEGVFNAPDLKVLALEVSLIGCPEAVTLNARVSNEGNLGVVAGVPVAFYRGTSADPDMLIGVGETTVPLLPGASTVVPMVATLVGDAPFAFFAVVDDDGEGRSIVSECDEDDNAGGIGDVGCSILF